MTDDELKIKFFDNLICAYKLSADTIKAWGMSGQLDKVVEECAELIVALQHSKSRTLDVTVVASEVADVLVMSMCAARIVGMDLVSEEMNKKLVRLKERLDAVRPKVDLEEKYNKAIQQSTELEAKYNKELARSEELQRQLLLIQSSLPRVDAEDEKIVDDLLAKQRVGTKKKKLSRGK